MPQGFFMGDRNVRCCEVYDSMKMKQRYRQHDNGYMETPAGAPARLCLSVERRKPLHSLPGNASAEETIM